MELAYLDGMQHKPQTRTRGREERGFVIAAAARRSVGHGGPDAVGRDLLSLCHDGDTVRYSMRAAS